MVLRISTGLRPEERKRIANKRASISVRFGAVLAALSVGGGAVAQSGEGSGALGEGIIEEIIVTAQKRSQNLQEVPVSITALTGEDVETFRFRDPSDLVGQVPNLQYNPITGDGTPVFSLRGVSMYDYNFNQASPVATYVDEVYKGNPSLLAVPLFDIERARYCGDRKGPCTERTPPVERSTSSAGNRRWRTRVM